MCKVTIDAFDTQEQAVAFVNWLRARMDENKVKLLTVDGTVSVDYDGMDTHQQTKSLLVMNITVDESNYDE